MFNTNTKLINCNTCGEIAEQIIKNDKVIKTWNRCREIYNNKKETV